MMLFDKILTQHLDLHRTLTHKSNIISANVGYISINNYQFPQVCHLICSIDLNMLILLYFILILSIDVFF
jgi:hypothetical protein